MLIAVLSLTFFIAANPLPEPLEIELALSAAPSHLRADASVLLLGDGGYEEARHGSNGFTCLVGRTHPKSIAPMCFDAEGSRTIVPRIRYEAAMRAAGKTADQISDAIQEGFDTGKYEAPRRAGISYMLSPIQELYSPTRGLRTFVPHLMFYGPNLTNDDIGAVPGSGSMVFMNATLPHGMIIVPLGEKERQAIQNESSELIEKTRRFLDEVHP